MKIQCLFYAWLFCSTAAAQSNSSGFNHVEFSTNLARPLVGILDFNVHVPVSNKQAVVLGVHHYSDMYTYSLGTGFFGAKGTNGSVYSNWIRSNVFNADFRFYGDLRSEGRSEKMLYLTVLNRVASLRRKSTTDLIPNPSFVDPSTIDPLDPEYDDWGWFGGGGSDEPEYLPDPNAAAVSSTDMAYRFGLEVGNRWYSTDQSKFRELGLALVFNPNGELPAWVLLNYRFGF